jgi:hypothetical protein
MVMAQTFDIRFARSAGLAGFLEAPANEYRWKGAGSLSIDAQGISIAVQRGLLTLFARQRSRRIAANNLLEIYREGDALRLEFSTPESARTVLPFWVRDSNAGAEIVKLLPTQHSVELEEAPRSARRYRFDRQLAVLLLVSVAALGFGALALQRYFAPSAPAAEEGRPDLGFETSVQESTVAQNASPSAATPRVTARAAAPRTPAAPGTFLILTTQRVELDPPALPTRPDSRSDVVAPALVGTPDVEASRPVIVARASRDGVIPIVPGDPAYEVARRQLDLFLAASEALRADYLSGEPLTSLERRWWTVTSRIYNSQEFDVPALRGLIEIELAVSRSWRLVLSTHAAGLRVNDPGLVDFAIAEREFAEMLEARARQFVY